MVEQIRLSRVGSIFNGVGVQVKRGARATGRNGRQKPTVDGGNPAITTWDVYNTFGDVYISTGKRRISEPSTVIKWGENIV